MPSTQGNGLCTLKGGSKQIPKRHRGPTSPRGNSLLLCTPLTRYNISPFTVHFGVYCCQPAIASLGRSPNSEASSHSAEASLIPVSRSTVQAYPLEVISPCFIGLAGF